jgi:hypothetical protein
MKRKLAIALLLTLAANAAQADDFGARAAAGRAAAANAEGSKYDLSLWPILREAGAACDPPGTQLPPSEIGHFALVGNILDTGRMIDIDVTPQTAMAMCYARQMSLARFASPPLYGRASYPVVVDLNVTP